MGVCFPFFWGGLRGGGDSRRRHHDEERGGSRRLLALPPYQKCIAFFFFFFFVFYNLIKYGGGLLPIKIRNCLINKNSGRWRASARRGRLPPSRLASAEWTGDEIRRRRNEETGHEASQTDTARCFLTYHIPGWNRQDASLLPIFWSVARCVAFYEGVAPIDHYPVFDLDYRGASND